MHGYSQEVVPVDANDYHSGTLYIEETDPVAGETMMKLSIQPPAGVSEHYLADVTDDFYVDAYVWVNDSDGNPEGHTDIIMTASGRSPDEDRDERIARGREAAQALLEDLNLRHDNHDRWLEVV